jgi:thymidylate synthase (FAD)
LHVKASILAVPEFAERFTEIAKLTQSLYIDMMDSGKVSVFDCRTILPVNKTHFYVVHGCIKDIINYVKQRTDEQIQPQSDNVVALQLWLELCKLYPFLKPLIDFTKQEAFFQKVARAGKTIIFPPNEKNDTFDWSPDQFFHDKHRDKFEGSDVYLSIRDAIYAELSTIK